MMKNFASWNHLALEISVQRRFSYLARPGGIQLKNPLVKDLAYVCPLLSIWYVCVLLNLGEINCFFCLNSTLHYSGLCLQLSSAHTRHLAVFFWEPPCHTYNLKIVGFANVCTVVWRVEDIITWRKIPRSSTYCVEWLQWETTSSVCLKLVLFVCLFVLSLNLCGRPCHTYNWKIVGFANICTVCVKSWRHHHMKEDS